MDTKKHWNAVYTTKGPENVSWFRPHLERSLAFLDVAQLPRNAAVIDVGGGASTLVDDPGVGTVHRSYQFTLGYRFLGV